MQPMEPAPGPRTEPAPWPGGRPRGREPRGRAWGRPGWAPAGPDGPAGAL